MCTKLSGVATSYTTKEKFDSILHFISKRFVVSATYYQSIWYREHLQARTCFGKESEFNVRVKSVPPKSTYILNKNNKRWWELCVSIERHGLGMTTMRWKESGKPGTQIRWPFCYCVFANSNSSAGRVSTVGSRPTIWWCPKPQLHVAQGHCIFKSSICSVSVFKIYISSLFTNVPGKPGGLRYNVGKNNESEYGGSGMRESPSRLRHLRGRRACQEGQYKRALQPLHLW